MKILIGEDDKVQAETLAALFKKMSSELLDIRLAHTFADTVRLSHEYRVDVTYLDPGMPDIKDWREAAHRLNEILPPVIILTGQDDPTGEMELEFYKYGAQNVFQKVRDITLIVPHLLSSGASAHLRRVLPEKLANGQ